MKPSLTFLADLFWDHFAKAKRVARERWGISTCNYLLDFVQAQLEVHQLHQGQVQLI